VRSSPRASGYRRSLVAELAEQLFEAGAGGLVAFDLAGPAAGCCVVDELLLDGETGA
jgi:hypothetical protein